MAEPLLQVENLRTYIYTRRGVVKAVDGASFTVDRGETLGLVGESGSGKSITAQSIVRLVPRHGGRIVGGRILLEGEDLVQKSEREMRRVRGRRIATILQDPMTSLDPSFTVGHQIAEAVRLHQQTTRRRAVIDKVIEALRMVGISAPATRVKQYPHQLSGGMRQRVSGAIAVACTPQLLIADEPTTALDVTIQAQFLKTLKDVQQELRLGMIFITHDLGIVANLCDRVAVMYAGRIVEIADVNDLFRKPSHPYTKSLLSCIPKVDARVERLATIEGQPPSAMELPPGCPFSPRCDSAMERCGREYPDRVQVSLGHWSSCHLSEEIHASYDPTPVAMPERDHALLRGSSRG